jgi:nucleotide-binding universal stress UspA family protein
LTRKRVREPEASVQEGASEVLVRRVIAGVSGSACSLQVLRYGFEISKDHDALLMPVLAWTPPGGELADRRYPSRELRAAWERSGQERLRRAVELAIGGPPEDVDFAPVAVRGEAGPVLTRLAADPGDILLIGAGRHGAVSRMIACKVTRYCLAHAQCPVIAVPPSPLATQMHGVHGWKIRHRMDPEDALLHTADA